jgi:DNA-binding NarL/FixJ family response regulator
VLLVDDHPIFREGLTTVIEREADLTVCGHAVNAHEALALVETLRPDLAVVDVSLNGSHGLDLLKDLRLRHPQLPVVMLSMHDELLYAESALRAGARGYVMKREPTQVLVQAVRKALRGELAFSEAVTTRMLAGLAGRRRGRTSLPLDRLSDRERQILELIGQGLATRAIAQQLHLSIKTVQTYRDHLKEKLELKDGPSLVRFAVHWVESGQRTQ